MLAVDITTANEQEARVSASASVSISVAVGYLSTSYCYTISRSGHVYTRRALFFSYTRYRVDET